MCGNEAREADALAIARTMDVRAGRTAYVSDNDVHETDDAATPSNVASLAAH
jgi:hypothetical protein